MALRRGDQLPDFEAATIEGGQFRYVEIWQHRNLIAINTTVSVCGRSRICRRPARACRGAETGQQHGRGRPETRPPCRLAQSSSATDGARSCSSHHSSTTSRSGRRLTTCSNGSTWCGIAVDRPVVTRPVRVTRLRRAAFARAQAPGRHREPLQGHALLANGVGGAALVFLRTPARPRLDRAARLDAIDWRRYPRCGCLHAGAGTLGIQSRVVAAHGPLRAALLGQAPRVDGHHADRAGAARAGARGRRRTSGQRCGLSGRSRSRSRSPPRLRTSRSTPTPSKSSGKTSRARPLVRARRCIAPR